MGGRHSGLRLARGEVRVAQCVTISSAVRIEDAHALATNHDRSHEASCYGVMSEVVFD
jgi:hypothetical protein